MSKSSCTSTEEALSQCPSCKNKGIKVTEDTIRKHVKKEHYDEIKSDKNSFNFCKSAICDIVYYSNESDETFSQDMVKHKIAAKNQDLDTPLCYCKRFTKQDAINVIESGKEDVSQEILDVIGGNCKCAKTNPKGVSCVEDITNFLAPYGIEFDTSKNTSSCCGTQEDSTSSCCPTNENNDDKALRFMKAVVKSNGLSSVKFVEDKVNKNSCC